MGGDGCVLYDMIYLGIGQALRPAFACALGVFHISLRCEVHPTPAISYSTSRIHDLVGHHRYYDLAVHHSLFLVPQSLV